METKESPKGTSTAYSVEEGLKDVARMSAKQDTRKGLRIRGARGHPVVRGALIRYARWLRANYSFPVRVPVYLSPRSTLTTIDDVKVTASFFAPFDSTLEPYIRIATGDYSSLRQERGRDDCLAAFIISLSHEIVHYQQWIETGDVWERGVAKKAVGMLRKYESTVKHP